MPELGRDLLPGCDKAGCVLGSRARADVEDEGASDEGGVLLDRFDAVRLPALDEGDRHVGRSDLPADLFLSELPRLSGIAKGGTDFLKIQGHRAIVTDFQQSRC